MAGRLEVLLLRAIWLLGVLLCLLIAASKLIAAAPLAVLLIVSLPSVRNFLKRRFALRAQHMIALALASIVTPMVLLKPTPSQPEVAQISDKEADAYQIMVQLSQMIKKGQYEAAIAFGEQNAALHDRDITKLVAEARAAWDAIGHQTSERDILAVLETVPSSDTARIVSIYRSLARLFPSNANYKELRKHYASVLRNEEAKAEERARRKRLGLTWTYASSKDPMTGRDIEHATVRSLNELDLKFPYAGRQRAKLTIRQHPRWGLDTALVIEKGQFFCPSECRINVRFDDGPIVHYVGKSSATGESTVLFIDPAEDLLRALQRSVQITVEAAFFNQGNQVMSFGVSDLHWPR